MGYSQHDRCPFCKSHPEKLNHFLYSCPCTKAFWGDFELFWFSGTQETINLPQQDVIVSVLSRSCPLFNYLLLIANIYLWNCRRYQTLPNINGLKAKILRAALRKYQLNLEIAKKSNFYKLTQNKALRALVTKILF